MQELSEDRLAELEAMAKAATPGPWSFRERAAEDYMVGSIDYELIAHVWHHEGDAAFIAATDPDTVLSLIAEVRRLRADRAKLWDALHALQDGLQCSCRGTDHRCGSCRVLDRARTVLAATEVGEV